MAVGKNDCRYGVVLTRGILNLSLLSCQTEGGLCLVRPREVPVAVSRQLGLFLSHQSVTTALRLCLQPPAFSVLFTDQSISVLLGLD